jgi:hypothetical protein
LVCNHNTHDRNCPSYKNNALKGASGTVNQQPKQFLFNSSEVNILSKVLEITKYYVSKNPAHFQQPKEILKEISIASNIINTRQNSKSNLKGASSNICNKKEHLTDILKLFNLT